MANPCLDKFLKKNSALHDYLLAKSGTKYNGDVNDIKGRDRYIKAIEEYQAHNNATLDGIYKEIGIPKAEYQTKIDELKKEPAEDVKTEIAVEPPMEVPEPIKLVEQTEAPQEVKKEQPTVLSSEGYVKKYDNADLEDFAKKAKFKTNQSNTHIYFNIDENNQIRITKAINKKSGASEGYRVTLHTKGEDGIFGDYTKNIKASSLQEAKKEAAKIYFDETRKDVSSSVDISDKDIDYSKMPTDELKKLGEKTNDFSEMAAIKKELDSRKEQSSPTLNNNSNEGGGGKPPVGEVSIPIGDGTEMIGMTHAEFGKIAEEVGIEGYEKNPKTIKGWNDAADKNIANGELPALLDRLENGAKNISPVEQFMLGKYVAGLKFEYDKNKSDATLLKIKKALEYNYLSRTEAAGVLRAGQEFIPVHPLENGDLASAKVAKMEANKTDLLTEAQHKEVEAQVAEYKKAAEDADARLADLEQKHQDAIAQMELDRIKAENKKNNTAGTKPKNEKEKREQLKEKLKKQYEAYKASGHNLGIASDGGVESFLITVDMAKTITEIAKSHIIDGATKLAEIVKKTYEEIKELIPDISERDVRDVFAGKYNEKKETKNELKAKYYEIQQEQKLLDEYDRVSKGEAKTEKGKQVKNKRLTELRGKINSLKKENKLDQYSDEAKLKRIIASNNASLNKIHERLKNEDYEPEKPKSFFENLDLKNKYPELYKEALEAIQRKEDAKLKFDMAILSDKMENESKVSRWVRGFDKVKNTSQQLAAGVDDSMMFVQLGNLIAKEILLKGGGVAINFRKYTDKDGNTKYKLGGAIKEHVLDAISKKRFERQMTALHNSPIWSIIKASGLDVLEPQSLLAKMHDEMFQHSYADKIGVGKVNLGRFLHIWERAYTSLGNNVRVDLFTKQANLMYKEGLTIENNLQEFKDLAKGINNLTGRGTTTAGMAKVIPFVTPVIWSPKMFASSINLLGLSDLGSFGKHGFYTKLTPKAREYVVKQMAEQIGVGIATMAAAAVGGAIVHYNPFDSRFGDVQYGEDENKSFNVWGRFSGFMRLAMTLIAKPVVSVGEKAYTSLGGSIQEKYKPENIYEQGGRKSADVVGKFLRGKFNPFAGVAYDYLANDQKSMFDKKPINLTTAARDLAIPMSLRNIKTTLERDGTMGLLTYTLPNFVGIQMKDSRDYEKNTPKFSKEFTDSPAAKILTDRGIELPEIKGLKSYPVEVDDNHPDGLMTPEEYSKFSEDWNKLVEEGIKELYKTGGYHSITTYDEKGMGRESRPEHWTAEQLADKTDAKGKALIKEKIEKITSNATKEAKSNLNIIKKGTKDNVY
jgi:hypothetical protein